jgi:hypothetical protein
MPKKHLQQLGHVLAVVGLPAAVWPVEGRLQPEGLSGLGESWESGGVVRELEGRRAKETSDKLRRL